MKRQVSYRWRVREIMTEHGMFSTTELVRPLTDRGITLSASQVHRLVTGAAIQHVIAASGTWSRYPAARESTT